MVPMKQIAEKGIKCNCQEKLRHLARRSERRSRKKKNENLTQDIEGWYFVVADE
jgi:hypothetical protein